METPTTCRKWGNQSISFNWRRLWKNRVFRFSYWLRNSVTFWEGVSWASSIFFFSGSAWDTLLIHCYSETLKLAACRWWRRWLVIIRVLPSLKPRNNMNQQDLWAPLYLTSSHCLHSTCRSLCNQRVCKMIILRVLFWNVCRIRRGIFLLLCLGCLYRHNDHYNFNVMFWRKHSQIFFLFARMH